MIYNNNMITNRLIMTILKNNRIDYNSNYNSQKKSKMIFKLNNIKIKNFLFNNSITN